MHGLGTVRGIPCQAGPAQPSQPCRASPTEPAMPSQLCRASSADAAPLVEGAVPTQPALPRKPCRTSPAEQGLPSQPCRACLACSASFLNVRKSQSRKKTKAESKSVSEASAHPALSRHQQKPFQQTAAMYIAGSTLVYIYIYIYIYVCMVGRARVATIQPGARRERPILGPAQS